MSSAGSSPGAGPGSAPSGAGAPGFRAPSDQQRAAWYRAVLDATDEGYMAWCAVREGGEIVDWVAADANAIAHGRWSGVVGDLVGTTASRMNDVVDNSRIVELLQPVLESGERQVIEVPLALPGGEGGWRRVIVTPLDADTVAVVTHDVSREHYLERTLARERRQPRARPWDGMFRSDGGTAEARFAARTAAALFLGSGAFTFVNSVVSRLDGVNVSALRLTALLSAVAAVAALLLPWKRHFTAVANLVAATALGLLVVSDHFDKYSRSPAAVAVYPVFFIVLIAWTGLTRSRGTATLLAAISGAPLYWIMAAGGRSDVGWQCVIVTLPVAATLGEVLSWTSHQARAMTNIEVQRRLHDPLTGLANRALLSMRLDDALTRVRRGRASLAVLYLDLDHFKHVNDTLGHNAGDDVLMEMTGRLQSVARETDTLARIGGDEFVIVCEEIEGLPAAIAVAQRLLDVAVAPCEVDGTTVPVTLSVGIAISTDGTETADAILQNADLALYRAKEAGRSRYEVYGDALRHELASRRDLQMALRQAIPRDELCLHYQPIVATNDGSITGLEALVRWERPGYGLVPPTEFIPMAEETDLIVEIGAWVLERACRDAAAWARRWPDRRLRVSVNLSGRQVLRGDVATLVRSCLARSGADPTLLSLELTESTFIDSFDHARPHLEALRDLGVSLAIDDFGTGYSSLTHLRRLPINIVKIDRSFVRAIGTEREDTAIVAAVINLAKTLGLHVVAEGVEEPHQYETLRALDCEQVQGNLFSPARPLDEVIAFVGKHEPRATAYLA